MLALKKKKKHKKTIIRNFKKVSEPLKIDDVKPSRCASNREDKLLALKHEQNKNTMNPNTLSVETNQSIRRDLLEVHIAQSVTL